MEVLGGGTFLYYYDSVPYAGWLIGVGSQEWTMTEWRIETRPIPDNPGGVDYISEILLHNPHRDLSTWQDLRDVVDYDWSWDGDGFAHTESEVASWDHLLWGSVYYRDADWTFESIYPPPGREPWEQAWLVGTFVPKDEAVAELVEPFEFEFEADYLGCADGCPWD